MEENGKIFIEYLKHIISICYVMIQRKERSQEKDFTII